MKIRTPFISVYLAKDIFSETGVILDGIDRENLYKKGLNNV